MLFDERHGMRFEATYNKNKIDIYNKKVSSWNVNEIQSTKTPSCLPLRWGISKSFPFPSDIKCEKYSTSLIRSLLLELVFNFAPPLLVKGGGFQPFPVFRAKARTTGNDRKPNPDKLLKIKKKYNNRQLL